MNVPQIQPADFTANRRIVTPAEAAAEKMRRRKLKQSLHVFLRDAWPIWMGARPFRDSWHIGAIAEHVEAVVQGQIQNLLLNQPPRTSKSSIVGVALVPWMWITYPHMHALCASYDGNLSKRDHRTARELIESEWYQTRWGGVYQLAEDQNTKDQYNNTRGGARIAAAVDGSITGTGGDIIVVDDPNNAKDVSDTALDNAIFWWNTVMPTRLNNRLEVKRIVVQQRLHERDLSGEILANNVDGDWVHLRLPLELEREHRCVTVVLPSSAPHRWMDPRKEEGETLDPKYFTPKVVADLKKELKSEYACTPYESPVLMGDLSLKPIGEVRVGDSVVGWAFTELPAGGKRKYTRQHLRPAKVLEVFSSVKPVVRVTLDSGEVIRCTPDHKWYVRWKKDGKDTAYKPAKIGRGLCRVCPPTLPALTPEEERDAGHVVQPLKWRQRLVDGAMGAHFIKSHEKVVAIEPDGEDVVYSLKTETGNYVVWGLASKNCSGQLQQRPSPGDGGIIKKSWFKTWPERREDGHYADVTPPRFDFIVTSIDTSLNDTKTSAYNAATTWGVFKDRHGVGNALLLSVWQKRCEWPEMRRIMLRVADDYVDDGESPLLNRDPGRKPDMMLVEDKGFGMLLARDLARAGKTVTRFNPHGKGDKTMRVRITSPLIEGGRVWLALDPRTNYRTLRPSSQKLLDNAIKFPKAATRDLVDTMAQFLYRMQASGWIWHPDDTGPAEPAPEAQRGAFY